MPPCNRNTSRNVLEKMNSWGGHNDAKRVFSTTPLRKDYRRIYVAAPSTGNIIRLFQRNEIVRSAAWLFCQPGFVNLRHHTLHAFPFLKRCPQCFYIKNMISVYFLAYKPPIHLPKRHCNILIHNSDNCCRWSMIIALKSRRPATSLPQALHNRTEV